MFTGAKEIYAQHFVVSRGIYVARADKGVPRRAIDGEKTEAGFARKRRRATAVAATGGAEAPWRRSPQR